MNIFPCYALDLSLQLELHRLKLNPCPACSRDKLTFASALVKAPQQSSSRVHGKIVLSCAGCEFGIVRFSSAQLAIDWNSLTKIKPVKSTITNMQLQI